MTLYAESAADQTDHFADAFVRENIAYGYDLCKFTVDAILFRETQCKNRDISMFEQRFQCEFG